MRRLIVLLREWRSRVLLRDREVRRWRLAAGELAAALMASDCYGVYGSDFTTCAACGAADRPGVLASGVPHRAGCPVPAALMAAEDVCDLLAAAEDSARVAEAEREELSSLREQVRELALENRWLHQGYGPVGPV